MKCRRPKQKRLNLTLGGPVVPWRKAVCRLETKLHATELETEMLERGMMFEVIDWSEDQG
jgi:hypothetical protein